ncbi:hypothetical protein XAC301_03370 [Xanthomonas arboricola pv. corylina]|uniref:Uncharacterized protein n=1 Tax=Xanthomonas arboricola pv. corylina TaxID=487821 RepID=A0A8D6UKD4_9XANT|nr:hypothetical protein XAC301_03370 [Xanthomonas arboricola pv. corylina]CAE6697532.1 hypothetical protein XAC301_03370 [Xanthomonas arboricola pv. corylina]CAE6713153.1 hypothetical protein CFBP1159_07310 [Xanthomonas arboricola pv. corylina]CAE6713172.1 hypothetical protein CFBP1159_07310 [Xanthomonas arboricola pv. corylina]
MAGCAIARRWSAQPTATCPRTPRASRQHMAPVEARRQRCDQQAGDHREQAGDRDRLAGHAGTGVQIGGDRRRSAAIGVSRLTGMNSEAISSATQSDIEPTALQVWRVATAAAREDGSVASELACMWGPCAKWNARRTPRRKRADAALDREPGVRKGCAAGSDALHRPASAATHDGRNAATDAAARACACLDVLQLTQAVNSDKDGGCARAYEALSSTTCLRRAPLPGADPQPL